MSKRRSLSRLPVLAAVLVGSVLLVAALLPSLPSLLNPFKETTTDRTGPAVLHSLDDLSEYHGSTGQLQVTVDVEKDTRYVPSIIKGEHVIYQAIGTVDGVVDLSKLGPDAVTVGQDGTVTVIVPRATLSEVRIDVDRSKVVKRSRGLLDRLGGAFSENPTSEQALQVAASKKLARAARHVPIRARAERNTERMLTRLLKAQGATKVVVRFADPAGRGIA